MMQCEYAFFSTETLRLRFSSFFYPCNSLCLNWNEFVFRPLESHHLLENHQNRAPNHSFFLLKSLPNAPQSPLPVPSPPISGSYLRRKKYGSGPILKSHCPKNPSRN